VKNSSNKDTLSKVTQSTISCQVLDYSRCVLLFKIYHACERKDVHNFFKPTNQGFLNMRSVGRMWPTRDFFYHKYFCVTIFFTKSTFKQIFPNIKVYSKQFKATAITILLHSLILDKHQIKH